jgi:hypothetical protein
MMRLCSTNDLTMEATVAYALGVPIIRCSLIPTAAVSYSAASVFFLTSFILLSRSFSQPMSEVRSFFTTTIRLDYNSPWEKGGVICALLLWSR